MISKRKEQRRSDFLGVRVDHNRYRYRNQIICYRLMVQRLFIVTSWQHSMKVFKVAKHRKAIGLSSQINKLIKLFCSSIA